MIMEEIIARLERILDQADAPESLDETVLADLPELWNRSVLELQEAIATRTDPQEGKSLRARLKRVIARIPEVQEKIQAYRSGEVQKFATENRRLSAMRATLRGVRDQGSSTYNRA
ncbi:MAG: hypothetical protein HQL53_09005 [Magnetococcales bacterium]|nr:hypothetical protein [Magnetococcales bacterium]